MRTLNHTLAYEVRHLEQRPCRRAGYSLILSPPGAYESTHSGVAM